MPWPSWRVCSVNSATAGSSSCGSETNGRRAWTPASVAEAMAAGLQSEPGEVLQTPHFLIGTVGQIIEDLQARRERFGISYVVVPDEATQSLAPVVERLTGT